MTADKPIQKPRGPIKEIKGPTVVRYDEATRFLWGDSEGGQVNDLIYGGGAKEIVRKSGAWFYYGEQRLGQGKENAKRYLQDNVNVRNEIETRVKAFLGMMEEEV